MRCPHEGDESLVPSWAVRTCSDALTEKLVGVLRPPVCGAVGLSSDTCISEDQNVQFLLDVQGVQDPEQENSGEMTKSLLCLSTGASG